MAGYGKKKRNNPHGSKKNMKRTHDKVNPREPGRTGAKVSNPGSTKTVRSHRDGKRVKIHRRAKRKG